MYNQAKHGPIYAITGDYLAEVNIANDAEAYRTGDKPGWIATAWDGLQKTVDLINEKRIKVVINGGGLNPRGLAIKTHELIAQKNLNLKVAYVEGDDLFPQIYDLARNQTQLKHLDSGNPDVDLAKSTSQGFVNDPDHRPIVSANAYLGIRAIKRGLGDGADIIICGRVSDASPVMAIAAWWHGWSDADCDRLAGALVAGHLIECSTYVTGANFAGFDRYDIEDLLDLGLPIVDIDAQGESTVTKHDLLPGFVTADAVKCQLLYELQGNVYLNSDVKADLTHVTVVEEATNRVHVSGVKGHPPPPTTKLAIFYRAGFQAEMIVNATGYSTSKKYDLQEAQRRRKLRDWGELDRLDVLDFQRIGVPQANPGCQLESTTSLRIFAQARTPETIQKVAQAWMYNGMAHFAGMHSTLDMRTLQPRPFLAYYPAVVGQSELRESVSLITGVKDDDASPGGGCIPQVTTQDHVVGPPSQTEPLAPRENYETNNPFGPTVDIPLGDVVLARSGDKGANVNIGIFIPSDAPSPLARWDWLRSFLTRNKMQQLMGADWEDSYFVERVEMPEVLAVHFVIYGPLERGVSSSRLLDALGKGFSEFIRAVHVPVPKVFV